MVASRKLINTLFYNYNHYNETEKRRTMKTTKNIRKKEYPVSANFKGIDFIEKYSKVRKHKNQKKLVNGII
jgi:hypothetical protein